MGIFADRELLFRAVRNVDVGTRGRTPDEILTVTLARRTPKNKRAEGRPPLLL
jgi:hypothetical protein